MVFKDKHYLILITNSCIAVCDYLFCFLECFTVQLTATGPFFSVTATLGEDVVLRYRLSPRTSAQNMEIKWFRSQNSSYVHHYRDGKDYSERQQLKYQGRTEFLRDGIDQGKIDLKIFNVSLFDEGQYHCSVNNGSFYQEATWDVKVTGK